jgi:hypothetical protein
MKTFNIWYNKPTKDGQVITYKGEKYMVITSRKFKQNSAYFKNVYYTCIMKITKE